MTKRHILDPTQPMTHTETLDTIKELERMIYGHEYILAETGYTPKNYTFITTAYDNWKYKENHPEEFTS